MRKRLERQVGVSLISCVLAERFPLQSQLKIKTRVNVKDSFKHVIIPFQLQQCLTVNSCEYV